jgi:flagellar basal-body rod protein FlgB
MKGRYGFISMSNYLSNLGTDILIKSLDAVWLRQRVISNNIANAETPGYKSKSVEFERLLRNITDGNISDKKAALKTINSIEPKLIESNAISDREDGNNVNLDSENIELARAQLQYSALITSLNAQINRIKYAISGGQ